MKIYFDDGEKVKTYFVGVRVAKALMTLLEADENLIWSQSHKGYGVAIVDKEESEE